MSSTNVKRGLLAGVIAAFVGSGVFVAATTLASASADDQLPHDPTALRAAMVEQVGQQFASFGSPQFVPLAPDLTVVGVSDRTAKSAVKADSAYLLYGTDEHSVKVFVGEANSELRTAPVDDLCGGGVTEYAVSCSAEEDTGSGGTVVTTVFAFSSSDALNAPRTMVAPGDIVSTPVGSLEFERNVRYFSPDGSMTSVTEALLSPSSNDVQGQFSVSVSDLKRVATDPELSWR
jgi:hypothetical protein